MLGTLIVGLALAGVLFPCPFPDDIQAETGLLARVLEKAGAYCDRLNRISLFYVCFEDVSETLYTPYRAAGFGPRGKKTLNQYIYDYQLIRGENKDDIAERRRLVRVNGKDASGTEASLSTERFLFKTVVYGPIGLFGNEARRRHRYSLEKEPVSIWGAQAAVVDVVPIEKSATKILYGRAFVDRETGAILKIEWDPSSLGNYAGVLEFSKELDAQPSIKMESQYELEKNGVHFPSRFVVSEDYLQRNPLGVGRQRAITKSELNVAYRDYKFFTVETTIK